MIRTGKILLIASAMGIAVLALAAMLLRSDGSMQPAAVSVAPAVAAGTPNGEPSPAAPVAVAAVEPALSAAADPETVAAPDVTPPAQDWDQVAADAAAVGMTSMAESPSSDTAQADAGQIATN